MDLETGEMFAYIRQQWRRTGLYSSNKPFAINDLITKVERQGQAMWAELEAEDQTPLVNIRRSPGRFEVPPLLPAMDEPAMFIFTSRCNASKYQKKLCERQNASRSDIHFRVCGNEAHDD